MHIDTMRSTKKIVQIQLKAMKSTDKWKYNQQQLKL